MREINNRFSDLYSLCLKTIYYLNFKLLIFSGHTECFKIGVWKVQDFGKFELSPMSPEQIWKTVFELFLGQSFKHFDKFMNIRGG